MSDNALSDPKHRALLVGAIVLAAGASRRMGGGQELSGETKALAQLAGRPLIAHVIDRLQPQVGTLYLSVDARQPALERWPYRQVEDPRPGRHGPLGGLLAVLEHARAPVPARRPAAVRNVHLPPVPANACRPPNWRRLGTVPPALAARGEDA